MWPLLETFQPHVESFGVNGDLGTGEADKGQFGNEALFSPLPEMKQCFGQLVNSAEHIGGGKYFGLTAPLIEHIGRLVSYLLEIWGVLCKKYTTEEPHRFRNKPPQVTTSGGQL